MKDTLYTPGHLCCPGCGESIAAKLVINTAGKNTIVVVPTGCLEVSTTYYPYSSWMVPFIHSLFENAAAVASGVEAALKALKKEYINVISQGGDGGTADIGLQALSGMWERGHNILSICYDNEAYMNTGIQRSGLTPQGSITTTSPAGNPTPKKDMVQIALAHGCVYVATATIAFPLDLQRKVRKSLTFKGPKYLHILCPCPLGWGYEPHQTYEISRLAVETGFFPLLEYENGILTSVHKLKQKVLIEEYLKLQRRFSHLIKDGKTESLQNYADENIRKYNLLQKD